VKRERITIIIIYAMNSLKQAKQEGIGEQTQAILWDGNNPMQLFLPTASELRTKPSRSAAVRQLHYVSQWHQIAVVADAAAGSRLVTSSRIYQDCLSSKRSRPNRAATTLTFRIRSPLSVWLQSQCKALVATVISSVEDTDCRCPLVSARRQLNRFLEQKVAYTICTYLLVVFHVG